MTRRLAAVLVALLLTALAAAAPAQAKRTVKLSEFEIAPAKLDTLRDRWVDRLLRDHAPGTWAPMRMELTDADLRLLGLPSRKVLLKSRFKVPTAVRAGGRRLDPLATRHRMRAEGPGLVSFAGTGFFGIRPGAFVLLINGGSIGWCSAAHVYGSPGAYSIATAGHCGKAGDRATVIGAVGNNTPVLIDFGRFASSTGDGGIGNDHAKISIGSTWQSLVTPTMAFWGGPIGTYTPNGEVVSADLVNGTFATDPNPTLVQQVVHYGHGTGVGAGGTPRSGTAITWRPRHFSFFGLITPGDSGSGTNTLTGDTLGANREAAGINTHIYVDASLRTGAGVMAGTRSTLVGGGMANGQIVPYPAPLPVPLP